MMCRRSVLVLLAFGLAGCSQAIRLKRGQQGQHIAESGNAPWQDSADAKHPSLMQDKSDENPYEGTENEEEDEEAIERGLHEHNEPSMIAASEEESVETEEEDEEAIQRELHANDQDVDHESADDVDKREGEEIADSAGSLIEEDLQHSTAGPKETALRYMKARKKDDLKAIRKLLTKNAKVTIPRKISGSDTYTGWTQIQKYLKSEPYPGDKYQRGGDKVRMRSTKNKYAVALIDFEVYKFFAWRKLRATFKINSDNKISDITVKKM